MGIVQEIDTVSDHGRSSDDDGDNEYTITPEFRLALTRWLDEPGNTATALAARLGCDRSLISQIKGGFIESTSLLPAICAATGIPFPHPHVRLAQVAIQIEQLIPGWVDSEIGRLEQMLRSLMKK